MGTSQFTSKSKGGRPHRTSAAPRTASDPPPQAAAFVRPAPPQAALSGVPVLVPPRHATNAGGTKTRMIT